MDTTTSPRVEISRRECLRAGLRIIVGSTLTAVGVTTYAVQLEPRWLKIERIHIPIPSLPPAFDGYRIVHLTDLHFGYYTPQETITRAIQMALALAPDQIALTGDYVLGMMDWSGLCTELSKLSVHGNVTAVMGNHDHWTDATGVRRVLADAGIPELRNASQRLTRGEQAIWLLGVDDIWEKHNDLPSALADVPSGSVAILLAHEPDYADEVALTGRIALQLSGHSHGGQVRIPGRGAPIVPTLGRKYPCGLYHVGGMWLYTNRGVGIIPPAVRVNCRPEVAEITLRRA